MTQSWLVSVFRNCQATPINIGGGRGEPTDVVCPNASAVAAFDAAARRGDIGWHAFPFNAEAELMNPTMLDVGLNMTFEQDEIVGHPHRRTLSLRDVPGLTRAAIPHLTRRGVVRTLCSSLFISRIDPPASSSTVSRQLQRAHSPFCGICKYRPRYTHPQHQHTTPLLGVTVNLTRGIRFRLLCRSR